MRVRVLGSAAGGAFPQWNCGCKNCRAVREGRAGFLRRTEDSLAVSADETSYVLVNAAPSVGEQIRRTPELTPVGTRSSPIRAIVLTNGDLDHVLGLFSLRESQPMSVYSTRAVREGLMRNAFMRTLSRFPGHTVYRDLPLGTSVPLVGPDDAPLGLTVTAHSAPGKQALHLEGLEGPSPEDNVCLVLESDRARVAYAAACGALGDFLAFVEGSDVVFFDGTFYSEDEMGTSGCGPKTAASMAHVPVSVSLPALASLDAKRKVFTHINNTNPLLDPGSKQAKVVADAGWEVAWDGMEIVV